MLIGSIGFAGLMIVAGSSALQAQQRTFTYRCQDGTTLTATFLQKPSRAVVQLNGQKMTLPQRRSGSGARYVKDDITFWIKGNEATFDRGRHATTCGTD